MTVPGSTPAGRPVSLALAAFLAVALAGCGDGKPARDLGPGPRPTVVTTVPGDRRLPHRWEGYTVAEDGATLTFTYYAGVAPCSVFDAIVADETPDSVRVSIYEHPGPDGVACIALAQRKSASVTLAAPLGRRTVVDGAPA